MMKKIIAIYIFLMGSLTLAMTVQEYEQKLTTWYGQAGTQVDEATWKDAVTWMINECGGSGTCNSCLLGVVQNKSESHGEMWVGTFNQEGSKTILTTPVGLNVHRTDAQKKKLARNGQCTNGFTGISCTGATCVGTGEGAKWEGKDMTAHATHYARLLNKSPSEISNYILHQFSLQTSDPQELFHDGYIRTTLGCLTQPLEQMQMMCENAISAAGAIYLYVNIENRLTGGNKESAARKLAQNPNWCNTLNVNRIPTVTSYRGPGENNVFLAGATIDPNATTADSSNPSTRSSTSGGNAQILVPLLGAAAVGAYILLKDDDEEEEGEEDDGPSYEAGTDTAPGNSITGDRAVMSGSERFRECQAVSTNAYSADVGAVNDGGEVTGRYQLADESGNSPAIYGPTHNNLQAAIFDNMDHDCIVQAAMDSRSEAFIDGNSPLEAYVQEAAADGRDPNQPLGLSGDEENRNSPVREITPVAGLSQTIDNEDALNVADANLEMDLAETELFLRNESDAISVFSSSANQFTTDGDKQASANAFANIGTQQASLTATRIRDFHGAKAMALTDHLDLFTTESSAMENCLRKYEPYRNKHPVWDRAMGPVLGTVPPGTFSPPSYGGERCQVYSQWQKPYLFKNQHVIKEVNTIVNDSVEIVDGMGEVLSTLNNRNLTEAQRAQAYSHPIWKKLAAREKYLKDCKKRNCFEKKQKALFPLTRYEGYLNHRKPKLLNHTRQFTAYINGTELPSFMAKAMKGKKGSKNNYDELKKKLAKIKKKTQANASKSLQQKNLKGTDQITGRYDNLNSARVRRSLSELSRGADGVLRNQSGKIVPGYEADQSLNLFEILSNRYKKKIHILKSGKH